LDLLTEINALSRLDLEQMPSLRPEEELVPHQMEPLVIPILSHGPFKIRHITLSTGQVIKLARDSSSTPGNIKGLDQ
jgi:hypothetical protein